MTRPSRWLLRAAQLLLIALAVWGIFRVLGLNLSELRATDFARWRPAPGLLLLATVPLLAVNIAQAFLWRRIVTDLTDARPSAATTMRVYYLAILTRYIPGKVWQIAGFAILAKRAGIPALGATVAAGIAQIAFLAAGVLFLTIMLPAWAGPLPALAAGLALVGVAGVLLWTYSTAAGSRLRARLAARFGPRVEASLDLASRIRPREAMIWAVAYSVLWLGMGAAFALFASAFVAPTDANAVRHLAGTVAAAYLGGYIAVFAPGGIGVREALMSALLAQIMPVSAALVVSIASRVWFTAAELIPLAAIPFLRDGAITSEQLHAERSDGSELRSDESPGTL